MASDPSTTPSTLPLALTIAGSDSGGGAGIQADLLTFAALGTFGTTALTCLTAQNPNGVSAVEVLSPEFVTAQLEQVASWVAPSALKTGMLFNEGIIHAVAEFLRRHPTVPAVVDPVMVATSGAVLLQPDAILALSNDLLPHATLITPNLDEVAVLLGERPNSEDTVREAAETLARRYETSVLVKGGHLDSDRILDVLVFHHGPRLEFERPRVHGVNTHGSGCTLAAAIAAGLAKGERLDRAVAHGLDYLARGMTEPLRVGDEQFIAHFR